MLLFFTLLETREDEEKFTLIYEKYKGFVTGIVTHKIHDPHKVEEIVQLVFVRIAKTITSINTDNEKRLKSYIYTIATNCCIDEINNSSGEPVIFPLDQFENFLPAEDDFEGIFAHEIVAEMMKYILRMPPIYRHVLSLYFVNELTVRQISWALEIPEKTVRTRINRGVKMLVKKAKELGYE